MRKHPDSLLFATGAGARSRNLQSAARVLGAFQGTNRTGLPTAVPAIRGAASLWHESRIPEGVLLAIPNFQGRVSPVFDVASRLTVVRVKGRAEVARREITLFETRPEGIARCLAELGVNVLVCGGISSTLERLLNRDGVRVAAQVCGDVEAVIRAFLDRTLDAPEFRLPGCFQQHVGRQAPPATASDKSRRHPTHRHAAGHPVPKPPPNAP